MSEMKSLPINSGKLTNGFIKNVLLEEGTKSGIDVKGDSRISDNGLIPICRC